MPEYKNKQKGRQNHDAEAAIDTSTAETQVDTEEIDDLLDEIDSVLEENAERFVQDYVQRGGE